MGIYKGQDKILNSITAIEEAKVKAIAKEEAKEVYSTDEVVIGTWIDGKPLYRKVFTFTNVSTNMDLSELNISDIITINCSSKQKNGDLTGFPYAPNVKGVYDEYIKTGYYKSSTKEWIWQFGSIATTDFLSGVLILEYIKTTD